MLIPVNSASELAKLHNKLIKICNTYSDFERTVRFSYGGPGKKLKRPVHYSSKLDFWWSINELGPHYWNAFGIGEPNESKRNRIKCEANYLKTGIDFRRAGLWAKDLKENYFFLHSGRIGGGQKGIGKEVFWDYYTGEKVEVIVNDVIYNYAVLGNIKDPKMLERIAEFVYNAAEIKQAVKGNESEDIVIPGKKRPSKEKYKPEFTGTKSYGLPEKGEATVIHGIIVDELERILREKYSLECANNKFVDLYTTKLSSRFNFEIKSGLSRQTLYTAIGQLLINSINDKNNPILVYVAPSDLKTDLLNDIQKLNILILKYKWVKKKPMFLNLDSILNE